MVMGRHTIFLVLAIVIEAIIFLALLVPFALPRAEVWQAAAFLSFFASFI
jgi:hypothetical protein